MSPLDTPPTPLEPLAKGLPEAPEDPETIWLRETYQPDAPNLTLRAAIAGVFIGGVMSLSNIWVFFKTGWSLGVTLTACVLVFALFKALEAAGARKLGALENNAATTVASGAGYMTAGGNAAAFGALMLLMPMIDINKIGLIAWFAIISALGVVVAIPIKRQLINNDGLPFPTGTATALTIRTIHAPGGEEGSVQAKALGVAAGVAAALSYLREGSWKLIPAQWAPNLTMHGHSLSSWSIAIKTELVLAAAGALMSFRTGWSMLLGATGTYFFLAPALLEHGILRPDRKGKLVSYTSIVDWTLWPGAAILVGAGLTAFALDWKSIARTFKGLGKVFSREARDLQGQGIEAVEAPDWWFPAGLMLLTPAIVALMYLMFDIPVWAGVLAVPLAIVFGFVASRVTGETDVTPTKALGPVTQMIYGVITPGNLTGNIMSANVTGGIGLHAADLLTTMKTGWLLGAKPRHQIYSQLIGVLAGAAIIVPLFYYVVPLDKLGSDEWPAPSAIVWANTSKAFVNGISSLPYSAQIGIAVGLAFGIGMTLVEKAAPKHIKAYLPSPSGIGLAMVIPFSNSLAMFLGAGAGYIVDRWFPRHKHLTIPIASGVIAGESIFGVIHTVGVKVLFA